MHDQAASRISGRTRAAVSAMCVRAVRITVLKSAGNFTRDECHDLNAEKIQPVKCFMFTRCGICCVPAIFERRRGRLGSKISTYGQLASGGLLRHVRSKQTPIGRAGMSAGTSGRASIAEGASSDTALKRMAPIIAATTALKRRCDQSARSFVKQGRKFRGGYEAEAVRGHRVGFAVRLNQDDQPKIDCLRRYRLFGPASRSTLFGLRFRGQGCVTGELRSFAASHQDWRLLEPMSAKR